MKIDCLFLFKNLKIKNNEKFIYIDLMGHVFLFNNLFWGQMPKGSRLKIERWKPY